MDSTQRLTVRRGNSRIHSNLWFLFYTPELPRGFLTFALFKNQRRIYHFWHPFPLPPPQLTHYLFAIIWATYFLKACRRLMTMIVERASYKWAYSEDIPGSRCGPEDGPWPRSYKVLNEKDLWRELRILAKPQSLKLDPEGKYKADSINFQPSPTTKTQDRYVVTQLEVHGRLWTFTGVFDGKC